MCCCLLMKVIQDGYKNSNIAVMYNSKPESCSQLLPTEKTPILIVWCTVHVFHPYGVLILFNFNKNGFMLYVFSYSLAFKILMIYLWQTNKLPVSHLPKCSCHILETYERYLIWKKRFFADVIKDLEIRRQPWIVSMGPRNHHMYPYKREAETD